MIKKMVFSKSQEDLEERYQSFIKCDHADSYGKKYPNLVKNLEVFWERRSEWALSFRMEMIFRNNHTNNYAEAAIRVLKEMIFGRMKAYNLIQMFNYITDTMEKYYKNRLLDMAHSRYRPGISLRFRDVYKLTLLFTLNSFLTPYTVYLRKSRVKYLNFWWTWKWEHAPVSGE